MSTRPLALAAQDVNQHDFVAAMAAMDPLTEHRHGRVDGCFRLRCIFRIFDDDADGHLNRSIPLASRPVPAPPCAAPPREYSR